MKIRKSRISNQLVMEKPDSVDVEGSLETRSRRISRRKMSCTNVTTALLSPRNLQRLNFSKNAISLAIFTLGLLFIPSVLSVVEDESGEESRGFLTDDNDVTSEEFFTTSSSVTPVKLTSSTGLSSNSNIGGGVLPTVSTSGGSGTGRFYSGDSTSTQGVDKENLMSMSKEQPTSSSFIVPLHSQKTDKLGEFKEWQYDDSAVKTTNKKKYGEEDRKGENEYKSAFIDLKNETREALQLQEEESNQQPAVFVGGSGNLPPNSLGPKPMLDRDPLWEARPVAEDRYPVPLQAAWDRNYRNPSNMTRVHHIEAECQDDFMKIRVSFNGSFQGLVYSSGYFYDPNCVYINGTGKDYYEYLIRLSHCGTLGSSNHVEGSREPSKNFMWNTVTIQYNPMIEEDWDEHFKLTCEYGYDFLKTVTFPVFDVAVPTGNPVVFTLTPPECYMEVRYGFGVSGTRVGGPVRVGDPLTLLISMKSQYDGFDIVVNNCYAHNGATKKIKLIDNYGCPVDSKLMSPFRGTWSHTNVYEIQVFAYLKTFRFTGSPALYIECDVRMCHGQCPSQSCYWRNVKNVQKRSVDGNDGGAIESDRNSTLSENLNLKQALRVLEEEKGELRNDLDLENVCIKTEAFTAMIGFGTLILVLLGIATLIMCFRLRRINSTEENDSSDILRPDSPGTVGGKYQEA